MSSAAAALVALATLQRTREEEGDVVIVTEGGATTKAHALVLSMGSEYFKAALSSTWQEEGRREHALQTAPAVLAAAIDYMYGIEVAGDFGLEAAGETGDMGELLELADRLLMDELKEEVQRRLARRLTVENYRNMCVLAERHHAGALAAACARFVVEEVAEPDWAAIQQVPSVATAMARLAVEMEKEKDNMYKKRQDFGSSREYGVYVKGVVKVGMKVRCCLRWAVGREALTPQGVGAPDVPVEMGDVGRVTLVQGHILRVAWEGAGEKYMATMVVELLQAAVRG